MAALGRRLEAALPDLICLTSRADQDPLVWMPNPG
jgi:hypothetical protein